MAPSVFCTQGGGWQARLGGALSRGSGVIGMHGPVWETGQ